MNPKQLTAISFLILLALPTGTTAEVRSIVFPVDGEATYRDDFRDLRGGGTREHLATDIFADKHTPLVSVVHGVVTYIPSPEPSWGYMITIQDQDGYQYRYIHINNDTPGTDDGNGGIQYAYAPGLKRGSEVQAGQLIGWLGDSGNAENTLPHLHFEIRTPSRLPINPYQSLLAAKPPDESLGDAPVIEHEHIGDHGVAEGAEFIFFIEMRKEMTGPAVEELQRRLKDSGHFSLSYTTKYFGSATEAALKQYQQANGVAPTGVLNFETRALLNGEDTVSGGLQLEKELFEGMRGEAVAQVQLKLKALGYYNGPTVGVFGPNTRESLRRFQVEADVSPTGYVNYETWNVLNSTYADRPTATHDIHDEVTLTFTRRLAIGSRGNDVVALQKELQDLGYFSKSTSATGYFGSITDAAVKQFQAANNIEAIGIVGPKTRAILNVR